ncbi:hypothetical protein [Gordonia phage Lizzo]|nr:hypothetical protein SEA_EKHEIN_1 [Gordonia phage Ekhein]WGH19685.1 hypothetical protein [Gordonia phage Lizzo]
MSEFATAGEALDRLIQLAENGATDDWHYKEIEGAVALISAEINTPAQEEMLESIQQLVKLLVNGSEYFHHIYQQLTIKLQLETDPTKQSQIAVGISETAGAAKALSWVVEHVMSDEAGQPASLEQIFTGEGLSYPAALKRGGSKLFIPKH